MLVVVLVLLLLLGVVLLVAEVVVIPGFGIAGIGGMLFSIGGLALAYNQYGATGGTIALVSSAVAFFVLLYLMSKAKIVDRLKLKSQIDAHVETQDTTKINVGCEGVTVTRINLFGKVKIDGETFQARSLVFIENNKPIVVERIENNCILVRENK